MLWKERKRLNGMFLKDRGEYSCWHITFSVFKSFHNGAIRVVLTQSNLVWLIELGFLTRAGHEQGHIPLSLSGTTSV